MDTMINAHSFRGVIPKYVRGKLYFNIVKSEGSTFILEDISNKLLGLFISATHVKFISHHSGP